MESSQFSDSQPRFETIEQVDSQGATCDTYRVKLYGKLHFLKRLKPQYAGDIRYQEALRKEFETGYRLEHPNLARYISLSDDEILMEYVDGDTLTQWLGTNPDYFKNREHTEKFIRQLLDVIGYLHNHQVLHLDLKPDNIMLTHIGNDVKLIDLGGCYTDTFPDTTGHTPRYAAPEQLSGGAVDERTDIYTIGMILENMPIHRKYNKVIAKCKAQTPDDRYNTISELHDALFLKKDNRFWVLLLTFCVILIFGYLFLTNHLQHPVEITEQQIDSKNEEPVIVQTDKEQPVATQGKIADTIQRIQSVVSNRDNIAFVGKDTMTSQNNLVVETSEHPAPIKGELSEEEKAFLSQPHLKIATDDEFNLYQNKLDFYYSEVNAFLNDSANLKRFPSLVSYRREYQNLISKAREKMKTDDWFYPLFNSPMNPISSYTRKYNEAIAHKAFINGNKLP